MSLVELVSTRAKVESNSDLDGEPIAFLNAEACRKRFVNHIALIRSKTGQSITDVFWSFIDWSFWMTMWECRYMFEAIEEKVNGFQAEMYAPYDMEECKTNAFAARDFLVEKNCGVSFGIMQSLWIQAVSENQEDFLLSLMNSRELNKHHNLLSKELGQFFTPKSLTDLMATMIGAPEKNQNEPELIYEPCAGFGGMLISHWNENEGMSQPAGKFIYEAGELSRRTARACFLNMIVHNIPAKVSHMNSLSGEQLSPTWYTPQIVGCALFGNFGAPESKTTITNPPFTKEFGLEWLQGLMKTEHE